MDQSNIRGFKVEQHPLAITFVVDSTALTAKGQAAVDGLVALLKGEKTPRATLIGHTDSSGPDAYNQNLSERRSRAVADYPRKRGRYHVDLDSWYGREKTV